MRLWDFNRATYLFIVLLCQLIICRPGVVPGVPVTRELSVHTIELMPNSQVHRWFFMLIFSELFFSLDQRAAYYSS